MQFGTGLALATMRRPAPTLAARAVQSLGLVSTGDPAWLSDAAVTGAEEWMYFSDFDGPPAGGPPRGRIKRAVSTDGGRSFGPATVAFSTDPETQYDCLETVTAAVIGGEVRLLAYGYDWNAAGTHVPSEADAIIAATGDGTAFTYAGVAIAPGNIEADRAYVMEPEFCLHDGRVDVFYTGANLTGAPGLTICHATSTDGLTFTGHKPIHGPYTGTTPADAFYISAACPSVLRLPDGRWLMAFTGINANGGNAGGISFGVTDGPDPGAGWRFGGMRAIAPIAPTQEVTGAAMRLRGANLHVMCSAVQSGSLQILAQDYVLPLDAVLEMAGLR